VRPSPARRLAFSVETEGRAPGLPDFGTLLRGFRLSAGLSQEALAERAGMSAHGISALERGYRRTPQRGTLALLAGALALGDAQRRALEVAAARWVLLRDGAKAAVLVGPWPETPGSNLPLSLASFVGRERELDEVAALVREHRLVTLTGAGGVGKTQTALQVATALSDGSAVWFVGISPLHDPSLLSAAIASTLRVQEMPNRSLLETLLEVLKNKAATVAHTLLAGCPRVRILATSREPLRAAGEHTYRLPSLKTPSREAAARLGATDAAAYGAIELFSDRARAVDHRFTLTDENAPVVAEICRRLDGIPLAIELAAARVSSLSITTLAEKLEDCFRVLAGGERTALPRHQTMRATIDWSYDLLSAPEQRLFDRLSIFAGGCTLDSATAVCADEGSAGLDVFDMLSALVDKSMVATDFESNEPRFRLLESFRQYAREKLAARGEQQVVAQRHARACLELAERLEYAREPDEVFRELALRELDDWRGALQWALAERLDVALGQRLVGALRSTWSGVAVLEGRHWIRSAFDMVDERTPAKVLAKLNHAEAMITARDHEYAVTLASSQSATEHYRVAGDSYGIASAQSLAGLALLGLGRLVEAQVPLQEALAVARKFDDSRLAAWALRLLGSASCGTGDVVAARDYLAEALTHYEAMGAKLGLVAVATDLGEYEFRAGNAELALRRATDALTVARQFNHESVVSHILANISGYLVSLDRYGHATACARELLDFVREPPLTIFAAWALQRIGAIAVLRPQVLDPAQSYVQAARILGFVDARIAAMGSARDYLAQQEYDRVLAVLRSAMGTDSVANLMSQGEAMTEEQAMKQALALL
jgi:predicted ATPase/transcriptional regulator with XRE-family HTH domain